MDICKKFAIFPNQYKQIREDQMSFATIAFAYVKQGEEFCLGNPNMQHPKLIRLDLPDSQDKQENWTKIMTNYGKARFIEGPSKGKEINILKGRTVFVFKA